MSQCQLLLVAALLFPIALFSQDANSNAFAGTWKLNVAKSKFTAGPAPKSETVTIPAAAGAVQVEQADSEGRPITWSFTPSGSEVVPIQGIDGATVAETRVNDHVTEHAWKMPNFNGKGRAVLSKDGKRMTYTMTGTNGQGGPVHDLLIFEKQ
jgi:PAB1-binding protein PBP1